MTLYKSTIYTHGTAVTDTNFRLLNVRLRLYTRNILNYLYSS